MRAGFTTRKITFEDRKRVVLAALNNGRRIRITKGQARAIREGIRG